MFSSYPRRKQWPGDNVAKAIKGHIPPYTHEGKSVSVCDFFSCVWVAIRVTLKKCA